MDNGGAAAGPLVRGGPEQVEHRRPVALVVEPPAASEEGRRAPPSSSLERQAARLDRIASAGDRRIGRRSVRAG